MCAIGPGLIRVGVAFDEEAVGADGGGGARQGRDEAAAAGSVAGIEDDGEVGELLEGGDGGDVAGVAGVSFKGADAALAEDDVRVAVGGDVFGGHEEFFQGGAEAAFEQDGAAAFSEGFEERVVLHIAGADLEHVGIGGDEVDVGFREDFGDDGEAGALAGKGEEAEAFFAEALELVRGGAGFEGAAAQEGRAAGGNRIGGAEDLVFGFDAAGAGDDGEGALAEYGFADLDEGARGVELAADQRVGGRDIVAAGGKAG